MNSARIKNLSGGSFAAAMAVFALSGCATSKQHSVSASGNESQIRWVAVEKPSNPAVANASSNLGSVVSPIGDAPGECDLARTQDWQWERQQIKGIGVTASSNQ